MTCTKKETKKNILHDMFKLKEMTEKINSGLVVRFSNYVWLVASRTSMSKYQFGIWFEKECEIGMQWVFKWQSYNNL